MRLSAELLGSSEQRTNPLGEREIILRGLAIPAIEHLGVTRDAFDSIDLTDNRLVRLDNFPRLLRVTSLLVSNNLLESLDANNLGKNVSNLQYLELGQNQISSLLELSNIGKTCAKLLHLNLTGNPVTRRQHYRLYTIKNIPSLKVLDYIKISKSERERADRLASSAAGAALEEDVQGEQQQQGGAIKNTFVPGEGLDPQTAFKASFTPEEKEQIRDLVANAATPTEIEEIEACVQRGVLPPQLQSRKRPPENGDHNDGEQSSKRSRSGEN